MSRSNKVIEGLGLQQLIDNFIQGGIKKGHSLTQTGDIWHQASSSPECDVLLTTNNGKEFVDWLIDLLKKLEPRLQVQVIDHHLTDGHGLYFTTSYESFLKGAELCHLKKRVLPEFGGGLKEFCLKEARCYTGVHTKTDFLTKSERAGIVKQMLEMIRAQNECLELPFKDKHQMATLVQNGRAIVPTLLANGLLSQMLPLHEPEQLKILKNEWAFSVKCQPMDEIHEYFGPMVAMYFAWLGHLSSALWWPAIFGMIIFFTNGTWTEFTSNGMDEKLDENTLFSDICFVSFALFNCVWSTMYLEFWKRKQAELSFKWGTYSLVHCPYLEDPRPGFKGDYFAANPVTGRIEQFFPEWKHKLIRYGINFPITFLCIVLMFVTMFGAFRLQDFTELFFGQSRFFGFITFLPMILYAVLIMIADHLYRKLAIFLNDLENYRTDDDYENFLIAKIVLFQCVSAFGSLFYITFYLKDMKKLQETMATLLVTRQVVQNSTETLLPLVTGRLHLSRLVRRTGTAAVTRGELESHLDPYPRPLDDYLEMFIQFGYVLLFAPAFPLAGVCLLVNSLVEIRVDAFKLCTSTQRPFSRAVRDVGAWEVFLGQITRSNRLCLCTPCFQS